METVKEFMPYIVSVVTAVISGGWSYMASKKKLVQELELVEKNNKHEIDTLMKQHEVNIDNLKETHKLEMESKIKEYEHEKEMQELKSKNIITEKNQELMNTAFAGVVGEIFKDVLNGKITAEQLENIQKNFPKKEN